MTPVLSENSSGTLLRLLPPTPEGEKNKLPILTTAADIRELIQYLKRRPAGVTATEELDRPKKRLFEDRKLEAYELLGITTREDQTLRLSPLGWKFAQRMESDAEVFRHVLGRSLPYSTALNWILRQNIDLITSTELRDFWHGVHPPFAFDDQEAMRGSAVSFFSICQASGLGTMTLGKRGHITRFFVDRDELTKFLAEASGSLVRCEGTTGTEVHERLAHAAVLKDSSVARTLEQQAFTVLIQSKNPSIVELIRRTLEITNVSSMSVGLVWDRIAAEDEPVPQTSREFNALIVVLDEDSFTRDDTGIYCLREKVLMELGAAHVLYDRRVILLADRRIASCQGFKDLIYYEFDSERLDWEVGLQLIKLVAEFRDRAAPTAAKPSLLPSTA